jgi:hypothetical protein
VDGTPASGLEYYLSTQLTGNSIFKPGDLFLAALRYANLSDSRVYVVDFNTAYHPYCYYNSEYDCPYPPSENRLKTPIRAGERLRAVEALTPGR